MQIEVLKLSCQRGRWNFPTEGVDQLLKLTLPTSNKVWKPFVVDWFILFQVELIKVSIWYLSDQSYGAKSKTSNQIDTNDMN